MACNDCKLDPRGTCEDCLAIEQLLFMEKLAIELMCEDGLPLSKPNRGRKSPKKATFYCKCDRDMVELVGKNRKCSHCGADFGKERKLHKVEPASVSTQR